MFDFCLQCGILGSGSPLCLQGFILDANPIALTRNVIRKARYCCFFLSTTDIFSKFATTIIAIGIAATLPMTTGT